MTGAAALREVSGRGTGGRENRVRSVGFRGGAEPAVEGARCARIARNAEIWALNTHPEESRLEKARWDAAANARAVTAVEAAILEVWVAKKRLRASSGPRVRECGR